MAAAVAMLAPLAWASPLSPTARNLIPSDVRQIISVDYRMARTFKTAMTLKAQALPDNLKEFEAALEAVGVTPDQDVESLTFASFDDPKEKLEDGSEKLDMVAVVAGSFSSKRVLTVLSLKKIKPYKYRDFDLYPVSKTLTLSLLKGILLVGNDNALKTVLSVDAGRTPNLDSNPDLIAGIKSVEKSTVWSVLDQKGTQKMLSSVLGDVGKRPEFATVKQGILGSHFTMNFRSGIHFDLGFVTSDRLTAAKLSTVLKAGVLYKKVTANPEQSSALNYISVTAKPVTPSSNRSVLKVRFRADPQESEALLLTRCFTALSGERKELSGITSAQVEDGAKAR